MRVLANLLLLGVVAVLGYVLIEDYYFPCRTPLSYEVGQVDPQFDVSEKELVELARQAEALWEDAADKDLLTYTQDTGTVEISLVFDERQRRTLDAREFEETLDEQERQIASAEEDYEALAEEYRVAEQNFRARVEEYDARRRSLNERVEAWNRSDRTDESEFRSIEQEERALEAEQSELIAEREELEAQSRELDQVLERRNATASEYNNYVGTYNERFGGGGTFDQGEYDGSDTEITIYQFDSETDLKLVLAHEFGHALGVDHVDDPVSVMHYLMREQLIDPIRLSDADTEAFIEACRL